jgi:hypothetical protein
MARRADFARPEQRVLASGTPGLTVTAGALFTAT